MRRDDRAAIDAATLVATNSPYSAAGILAAYGRHAQVVPPGIAEVFAPSSEWIPPQHILSVGTLIPSKGHDVAAQAIGRAGIDLPLVIVTPRANAVEEQRLRQLAAEVGVRLHIRVAVSDHELAQLYRSAFVTMYLARAEPLGLVSLESQACGTPVIVADEGGLGGTVLDSVTGYRVRRDAEAASHRLAQLNSGHRREQMARQCLRSAPPRDTDAAHTIVGLLRIIAGTSPDQQATPDVRREQAA
jgi:glycosyltransferase involved in cell wall biosynthesis